MSNPFDNVPLNTLKQFVRGITLDGCKVYLPVDSTDEKKQLEEKKKLQIYLDNQYEIPPEVA